MMDSFVRGKQKLFGLGERKVIGRKDGEGLSWVGMGKGIKHVDPWRVAYIQLDQKVCMTNAPIMDTEAYIRNRVCGAVLLRVQDGTKDTQKEVAARGEIGSMVHFADLQQLKASQAESYLVFADTFDVLMDQGWTIAQSLPAEQEQEASKQGGKRKEAERDGDSNDDESATKKQMV